MQDGLPAKLYEYMAMKKPVISTKLPGVMREFGQDNGIVYIDKPEDVVIKATELVGNANITEIGLKARNFVEGYSWDGISKEYENILEEVISNNRKN